jgi:hypothetical protein
VPYEPLVGPYFDLYPPHPNINAHSISTLTNILEIAFSVEPLFHASHGRPVNSKKKQPPDDVRRLC